MNDPEITGVYAAGNSESFVDAAPAEQPRRIGRYRVERILGQGGFGIVYLAHDDQLQRPVAAKVPHSKLVSRPEDAEAYLIEARTVANLDHPNNQRCQTRMALSSVTTASHRTYKEYSKLSPL